MADANVANAIVASVMLMYCIILTAVFYKRDKRDRSTMLLSVKDGVGKDGKVPWVRIRMPVCVCVCMCVHVCCGALQCSLM
jgi:ABC-type Fe3+ transport system permease subunit